jgi:hypothetical protein
MLIILSTQDILSLISLHVRPICRKEEKAWN